MSRRRQWGIGIALAIAALVPGAAWADAAATPEASEAASGVLDDGDFLLAPVGAGPIVSTVPMGTNGKGLPVPLPELVEPEPAPPSLLLDSGRETLDTESVLRMPARDVRPVIAPES